MIDDLLRALIALPVGRPHRPPARLRAGRRRGARRHVIGVKFDRATGLRVGVEQLR